MLLSRRKRNIKTISISAATLSLPDSQNFSASLSVPEFHRICPNGLADFTAGRDLPIGAPSPEDRSFFYYLYNIQHFLFYSRGFQRVFPVSASIKSSQRDLSASRKSSSRIAFSGIQRNSCPSFATGSLLFFRIHLRKTRRIAPAG